MKWALCTCCNRNITPVGENRRNFASQSARQPTSRPVRVLTVMAGRQETVKDLSVRYVGRFDDELFEEIRKLNPDLKDPDHLEDGQLIRMPLRAATPVN